MSKKITEYIHTDENGSIEKIRFTERSCGCSSKCYPDTLEIEDCEPNEYLHIDIDTPEIAFFIKGLLDKSCEKADS